MTLGLIWAQAHNRVIGHDGVMPWHVPEDLAHFKAVTGSSRVVMGRRTWESIPERFRPLPGRDNIVITRDRAYDAPGAAVWTDLDDALRSREDTWVIGGADIYAATIGRADVLEVTELDLDVDGDTFAPVIGSDWIVAYRDPHTGWHTSRTGVRYRFLTYHQA